jgi:hypothetical protein
VGTIRVVDFTPTGKPGGWQSASTSIEDIGLPFALGAIALGMPKERPLNYELVRLEVDLISRLIDCTPGRPLRRRSRFGNVARRLRSLSSEAIGLAATAHLAGVRHGWESRYGWPQDFDASLIPLTNGVRPDLLFPTAEGDIAGEARCRSQSRRTLEPATDEITRIAKLDSWAQENGTKVFMAWAWTGIHHSRVDHFDPEPPQELIDPDVLTRALIAQAEVLRASAVAANTPVVDGLGIDIEIHGAWLQPVGIDMDVFLGVLEPDVVAVDVDELRRLRRPPPEPTRRDSGLTERQQPRSAGTTLRIVDGLEGWMANRDDAIVERPAVVGPVITAVRRRRQS